jgi:hypothetical protein
MLRKGVAAMGGRMPGPTAIVPWIPPEEAREEAREEATEAVEVHAEEADMFPVVRAHPIVESPVANFDPMAIFDDILEDLQNKALKTYRSSSHKI